LLRVSRVLGIPPADLGLSNELITGGPAGPIESVKPGQDQWRAIRRHLNHHRNDLARLAAALYPTQFHIDGTPLIAPRSWLPNDGDVSLRDLPFRSLIGDPFDLQHRAVPPAITTLTLRRTSGRGSVSFLLHWRDPRKVATAAGLYDVIPAGEFQPSSIAPHDLSNDFDIWRNILREYSEELLGTPEHDGSRSAPIDYDGWPFYRELCQA